RHAVILLHEEEVRRLDVAMDDSVGVRDGERLARLHHQLGRSCERNAAIRLENHLEIFALEILHDDVWASVYRDTDVVYGGRVFALDLGGGFRLSGETANDLGFRGELVLQELDRDGLFELQMACGDDDAHAAFRDDALHPIAATDHFP